MRDGEEVEGGGDNEFHRCREGEELRSTMKERSKMSNGGGR